MNTSIVLDTDSYKVSMWKQYPAGTEYVYSYISSRGGKYKQTEFDGIQRFAKRLAKIRVTKEEVDYANKVWTMHGEPFNYDGWMYIVNELDGKLPVRIKAAREGMIIPTKNVLATIENTDPKCYWLTTWLETPALRAIWYPTTVGTASWHIKQELLAYLEKSGTPADIDFKLHDFGARGVSSEESARIGGKAHLINFKGTDTFSAVLEIMDTYNTDEVMGFSIPASEHSTITSWGRENELEAYRNMVTQFGKPGQPVACVSDSYDIYNACKMWGSLKNEIISSGAILVIRPDSGDPLEVLPKMVRILDQQFGSTPNSKGYRVLNNVRVIWGDGINATSLSSILRVVVDVCGYSADNFAFGMGGGLLQQCDRDTLKFAMKCSSIGIRVASTVEEMEQTLSQTKLVWRDVFKDPITDSGKSSLKGRVTLWQCGSEYETDVDRPTRWVDNGFEWKEALETYFLDGDLGFTQTFEQVRANSNQ